MGGGGGMVAVKPQIWRFDSLPHSINVCVRTCQASVTYNWRVSGADAGGRFSPPSTRIVCCHDWSNQRASMYIYYGADLEVEGRPLLIVGGGWGADDSQDSHESFPNAPPPPTPPCHLIRVSLLVAVAQFNQNSLIVRLSLGDGFLVSRV